VLVEGSIDTEVDAVRTGLGTAYLAAGTITVFSTWFSHSRLEVASPLLAAALLLQAGYFWIRYLSTPTR
jgi:hypothetical protein